MLKTLAMASLYFGVSSPRTGETHMWANENYLSPPNAGGYFRWRRNKGAHPCLWDPELCTEPTQDTKNRRRV